MTALAIRPVAGVQKPRVILAPPYSADDSAADEIIDLCTRCGLILDPWQQDVLRRSLIEDPVSGLWQSKDVAVVCSRQNGKNAILEARLLGGLFVLDEGLIIHTAHEMKAAAVTFERLERFIRSNRALLSRVEDFSHSKGGEAIELKPLPGELSGSKLLFIARTGGSGRSFSSDTLILDEAYNLPAHVMNAITPTLASRLNPQVWYTSSAVNQIEHPHGLTLARVRRRGLKGEDPTLAYFEWSADDAAYKAAVRERREREFASDPNNWAVANPSLGIVRATSVGVGHAFLQSQLQRLGAAGFAAEHLSIGDWPEEPSSEASEVIDRELWGQLVNRLSQINGARVFGISVNEAGDVATISAAGLNADGMPHIEVVEERRNITWVADRIAELVRKWEPLAVLVDPGSPAGSLIVPIENAVGVGFEVTKVNGREYGQACSAFQTAAVERPTDEELADHVAIYGELPVLGGFRHLDDPRLNFAVENASTRPLLGTWVWEKDTAPALVSCTLALYGLTKYGLGQPTESWGYYE